MSTLAEHVAAIQFYRANYDERENMRRALDMELWLLASAHLKEVAAMVQPDGLQEARDGFAADLRKRYGEAAEPFIARWHAAFPGGVAVPAPPDFDAVRDKRMSELTPEQQRDARELWIMENIGWFTEGNREHIKFLLERLNEARSPAYVRELEAKRSAGVGACVEAQGEKR